MGKVYEGLKRAEVDGHPAVWSSVGIEKPSHNVDDDGDDSNADFMNYSLNALNAVEIEERNKELAARHAARKSIIKPAREITVDPSRIALSLSAFQNLFNDATEEYNRLAITLITASAERPIKRILIASAQHGEGRTSIALNLACALARSQRKVLVVDADLHRPSLLRFLGLSVEVGLTDALKKGLPAGSAVVRIKPFGFDILPTREQVKNPAELLSSTSFGEMLELFEPDYDFILFDSPPLLGVADSTLLIRQTDAAVLVIRSGKTTSGQIGRAVAPLSQEKILGVVLNRARDLAH